MADRFENGFGGLVAVVTGGGTGMGRELFAAELSLRQLAPLDHHAPAAVEDEDAFGGRPVKGGLSVSMRRTG